MKTEKQQIDGINGSVAIPYTVEAANVQFPVEVTLSTGIKARVERMATGRDQMEAQKRSGSNTHFISMWVVALCCVFEAGGEWERWSMDEVADLTIKDVGLLQALVLMGKFPS